MSSENGQSPIVVRCQNTNSSRIGAFYRCFHADGSWYLAPRSIDATDIAFSSQANYGLPSSRIAPRRNLSVFILDRGLTFFSFFNSVVPCGTAAAARSTEGTTDNVGAHYVEFQNWANAYRCHYIAFQKGYNVALLEMGIS